MGSPRIHPPTQSELEEPRFHLGQRMLITGVKGRFTGPDLGKHSALWQSLAVHLGKIPGQVASITYGVCYNIIPSPFSFEYMAGVEISEAQLFSPISLSFASPKCVMPSSLIGVMFPRFPKQSTRSTRTGCPTRASSWFKEFPMLPAASRAIR